MKPGSGYRAAHIHELTHPVVRLCRYVSFVPDSYSCATILFLSRKSGLRLTTADELAWLAAG